MRILPDRQRIPHHLTHTSILPSTKVIQGMHRTSPRSLLPLERTVKILLPEIHVKLPSIHYLRCRQAPASPLPPLRSIAHQCPFVAAKGDEEVRAFSSQSIFQPTECAGALAIVGANHILVRPEVRNDLGALVPNLLVRIPFHEGQLGWSIASVA